MARKPKPADICQSVWEQTDGTKLACTNIAMPKGSGLTKIVLCEESKPKEHAGVHLEMNLPDGFKVDAILVFHQLGERVLPESEHGKMMEQLRAIHERAMAGFGPLGYIVEVMKRHNAEHPSKESAEAASLAMDIQSLFSQE